MDNESGFYSGCEIRRSNPQVLLVPGILRGIRRQRGLMILAGVLSVTTAVISYRAGQSMLTSLLFMFIALGYRRSMKSLCLDLRRIFEDRWCFGGPPGSGKDPGGVPEKVTDDLPSSVKCFD